MKISNECCNSSKKEEDKILSIDENIVGIGAGEKVVNDKKTGIESVVVLVKEKKSSNDLDPNKIIPKNIGNFPTDVVEVGHIVAETENAISESHQHKKKHRPIICGISIGHHKVTAGTMGFIVKRKGDPDWYILSNNHVIANTNDSKIGDDIYQPGLSDSGSLLDTIAQLIDFVPIDFNKKNKVDCAIARLNDDILFRTKNDMQGASGCLFSFFKKKKKESSSKDDYFKVGMLNLGEVSSVYTNDIEVGQTVQKSGRTTGYTTGEIKMIGATVKVAYNENPVMFKDQIITSDMSKGGDSGSTVLNEKDQLVGLLFAGSKTATIINPIEFVIESLNLDIEKI